MKKTIYILFLAALILFAGCQPKAETLKIGWIGPLTGQAAVLGVDSVTAAQMAVDDINGAGSIHGKQLLLIPEDDQYDTKQSVTAYEKLVRMDGVKVIVIQTYSAVFALSERARADGVVLIDALDCHGGIVAQGENVFCLSTDSDAIYTLIATYAQQFKKVGVFVFQSDAFMPFMKDGFLKLYKGEASVETYSVGEMDFRTSLLKMQQKGVEALVLLGYDESGILMKQARDLGFKGPFIMTGTVTSPALQEAAQGYAEGTIFPFWRASKTEGLAKTFTEKFVKIKGREPLLDLATYPTYDVVYLIAKAFALNESGKFTETLHQVVPFQGVTGEVHMAPDGSARLPEKLHVLQNGKAVPLDLT